ncbi:dihydroneopterin aldolase [Streptococcus saliviloxodontae]|uniref:7,8-dihydroneopterin aldolase n=1 Tax=Streptococcus saliviloxodontae TaxID=1349416 RepID=A0ABS2PLK7_9STRE|nr:dihydroneopterin aldolase [Streptococcus saliviloxodontae]MBM7636320.1 dihydroneopterin aldolase [Streptococcus saliviloxodontae]
MDKIILNACRFYGYHGAFQEEQTLGQIFVIDVELSVDLQKASQSDLLEDTVHYGHVFEVIQRHAEQEKYVLIERLAGAICDDLFEKFQPIQAISIRITKENPPINGHYTSVGIELERSR